MSLYCGPCRADMAQKCISGKEGTNLNATVGSPPSVQPL